MVTAIAVLGTAVLVGGVAAFFFLRFIARLGTAFIKGILGDTSK